MGDADDVLADLKSATRRLLDGMAGLSDEAARQPSLLPGWSRGHVLTHCWPGYPAGPAAAASAGSQTVRSRRYRRSTERRSDARRSRSSP